VHVGDLDDYQVFYGASKLGNVHDVKRLINKGVPLNGSWHHLSFSGSAVDVPFICHHTCLSPQGKDVVGKSALHYAVEYGHVSLVMMLLQQRGIQVILVGEYDHGVGGGSFCS
jgi:hypothetical protein